MKNLEILKVPLKPQAPGAGLGSSDIGNVSQVVPTIHPYLLIGEEGKKTPGHSIQFAKAASSEKGQE
ncbi:MAG: M20 family peptidase, partial [Candidatus Heimdallarchaeota archaeon]